MQMMRKLKFGFLLTLSCLLIASCADKDREEMSLSEIFSQINDEVLQNSEAYSRLEEATSTIGHRLTGSPNGTKSEQYAYDLFMHYGFDQVEFMEFEVEAWMRESLQTKVKTGDGEWELYPSVALAHTPVSYQAKATLLDLGNGLAIDYERLGDQVKGKYVLVYLGLLPDSEGQRNLHRSEKTALAAQNGAAGIVFYNSVPGGILLTGTASVTGSLIDIPAICLTHEAGMELAATLAKNVNVQFDINMKNKSEQIKARNVIATLKGGQLPNERVLVGGHLDSWDLATGAFDNGIGSFAILDMARTFKTLNLKPKRTLQFVMFMGEEQGLLGSRHFVQTEKENGSLDQIKYMMNIDMAGNPTAFNGGGRDVEEFYRAVGEQIKSIDSVFINNYSSGAGLHSDHQPFMLEGIPHTGLVSKLDRNMYRCYHADCDDISLIKEEDIRNTVRFSSMMLYALADANELPAKRLSSDDTRKLMETSGLREKLELGGDWKW